MNQNQLKFNEDTQWGKNNSLRPQTLDDFLGQPKIIRSLKTYIYSAKTRKQNLDHILLSGSPGLGKTTLAQIIAYEMHHPFVATAAPSLEKSGDLVAILTTLEPNSIFFIDEIHRLKPQLEEILYPAMEDFKVDIILGQGQGAKSIKLTLPPFTLIGATTKPGALSPPFQARFGIDIRMNFYDDESLQQIILKKSQLLNFKISSIMSLSLAKRSRGTPRYAQKLLKRILDFAVVLKKEEIDEEVFELAMTEMGIDHYGLGEFDRQILMTMYNYYGGKPVGIQTLSAALGEDLGTLEDMYEPFLIRLGFIKKTSRGRILTEVGLNYLGKSIIHEKNYFKIKIFRFLSNLLWKNQFNSEKSSQLVRGIISLASFISFFFFILFYRQIDEQLIRFILFVLKFIPLYFVLEFIFNSVINHQVNWIKGSSAFILVIGLFLILYIYYSNLSFQDNQEISYRITFTIVKNLVILFLVLVLALNFGDFFNFLRRIKLDFSSSFSLSFIFLILVGTFLLNLNISIQRPVAFQKILFTAVSAVTVTGLGVIDVGKEFTTFGKTVLLILIQLGGLGIVTFTSFFMIYTRQNMTYDQTLNTFNLFKQNSIATLKKLLNTIFISTFILEASGTIFLFFNNPFELHVFQERIFHSIFYAVSAFCNAGFTLESTNLQFYNHHVGFLSVIMTLITLGGLGFQVFLDLYEKFIGNRSNLSLNSKIVIIGSLSLFLIGSFSFFFLEYNNILKSFNGFEKILQSAFYSVSTRTAGFNITSLSNLKPATQFFMSFLMFIGASPLSTGGGLKTTTFILSIALLIHALRKNDNISLFGRKLPFGVIQQVGLIFFIRIMYVALGVFFISVAEGDQFSILAITFETISAISTVGLSLGITEILSSFSQWVLMFLMFFGRVGPFYILSSLIPRTKSNQNTIYPTGKIFLE